MDLWRVKHAFNYFWSPVSPMDAPGYYEKISQPISLSEIRNKIADYKYEKADELIADLTIMANNAELYNGANSPITTCGYRILEKMQDILTHERKHLGADKDPIAIMEDAIQKKKTYLKNKGVLQ